MIGVLSVFFTLMPLSRDLRCEYEQTMAQSTAQGNQTKQAKKKSRKRVRKRGKKRAKKRVRKRGKKRAKKRVRKRGKKRAKRKVSKRSKKRKLRNEPALSLQRLKNAYLRELKKDALKNTLVGWSLRRLDNGEVLLGHRSHELFHPASNTKLVTTAAAARIFDGDERFVTRWYFEAKDSRSPPDLYWRASGDPKLVPESYEAIASKIKTALKKRSKSKSRLKIGDLIIDTQDFTDQINAPGFEDKPNDDAPYRAPNGGVGFQFNRFTVRLKPAKRVGHEPLVSVHPPLSYFKIENQAKTSRRGTEQLKVQAVASADQSQLIVKVSGKIPRGHRSISVARRIANPTVFAGQSLLYYLKRAGVRSAGGIREGEIPVDLEPIAEHRSPSMSSLLRDINVYSNNYMAEQIVLALGLKVREFASWKNGTLVVRSYLEGELGIKGYRYQNGSGLFGETAFSPHMLTEVLIHAHQATQGRFAKTLPMAGKEGTMRRRLRDIPRGDFRAKTGTLDHVSTLCGYLTTREKVQLVLCLMMNQFTSKVWKIRSLQDEMVTYAWLLTLPKPEPAPSSQPATSTTPGSDPSTR